MAGNHYKEQENEGGHTEKDGRKKRSLLRTSHHGTTVVHHREVSSTPHGDYIHQEKFKRENKFTID